MKATESSSNVMFKKASVSSTGVPDVVVMLTFDDLSRVDSHSVSYTVCKKSSLNGVRTS